MVLGASASKVSMNSAAVNDPRVTNLASRNSVRKITSGHRRQRNPTMPSGFEQKVVSGGTLPIAKTRWRGPDVPKLGAGVIRHQHGRRRNKGGYDIPFTKAISSAVSLRSWRPGGAGGFLRSGRGRRRVRSAGGVRFSFPASQN